jgi:1-acyl-sn-glycerol-3-phosphate acyltransferase
MNRAAAAGSRWSVIGTLLGPVVGAFEPAVEHAREIDPFQRDPESVRRILPLLRAVNCYFSAEIRGWKNVPKRGPFLLVGNHSGGAQPIDPAPFLARWIEERGAEAPVYALAYDLDIAAPVVGSWLRRLGMIPASHDNAMRAFEMGAPVIVFPGGDYEVFRPWRNRNRIAFGGRDGFVKLALAAGVPVVPMTIHGAHESTFVLTRGHRLARLAGLDRLNVQVFPFVWNIPFGVMPAFIPTLQLPAKITIRVGTPIDWSEHGPEAADDPEVVQACYRQVTRRMQRTLTALAREDPCPILTRLGELRPDRITRRALARILG